MKRWFVCLVVVLVSGVMGPVLAEDKTTALPKDVMAVQAEKCPVMGEPVDEKVTTLLDGKVYFFCCPECIGKFTADPAKYAEALKGAKEVPLKITNVDGKCPMSNEAAKPSIYLVRGGNITFYCCSGCVGKDPLKTEEAPKKDEKPAPPEKK